VLELAAFMLEEDEERGDEGWDCFSDDVVLFGAARGPSFRRGVIVSFAISFVSFVSFDGVVVLVLFVIVVVEVEEDEEDKGDDEVDVDEEVEEEED